MTELSPHEAAIVSLLLAEVERGDATPLSPDRRQMRLHSADLDAVLSARDKGACFPLRGGTKTWPIVVDDRFESPRLVDLTEALSAHTIISQVG